MASAVRCPETPRGTPRYPVLLGSRRTNGPKVCPSFQAECSVNRAQFKSPPWHAALDVGQALASISPEAAIAGMFFLALADAAKRRGVALGGMRERYLPFRFYPVSEFAPLLVTAAGRFYPDRSLRQGLRAIGHSAPAAFLSSTLGKVTLGSAVGVQGAVDAIAKTYGINTRPCQALVRQTEDKSCVVEMRNVQYFLDSHHVGVFEGTLAYVGVRGHVHIAQKSADSADFLLEWA